MIEKYGKSVKMKRINRTIDGIKQQIETCQANAVKYHRNKSGGQCRVCGSVSSHLFVTIYGLYHYHECEVCGSVFLDNLPDFQNMYQEDNEVNGDIYMDDSVYETRVEMISAPKVEFVLELCGENAVKPSQWLDIGCGGGGNHFLPEKEYSDKGYRDRVGSPGMPVCERKGSGGT